ncbi:MAG: glycoside hydrolase family 127 protein [Bacteroidales bacterium]|nr:glycoside hydrolase family 127 protein [Bacteroidales bacterium]
MKNKQNKYGLIPLIAAFFFITTFSAGEINAQSLIEGVPFTKVKVTDEFWAPKIQQNYEVTIPIAIKKIYESGAVNNFKIAGGLMEGKMQTNYPFNDTDVYKLIEAASYSLLSNPDPLLEARLDTLIHYISLAQEPDGYIYTTRTIDPEHPHPWADSTRWTGAAKGYAGSHELYNCGHFFEAATAHYAATGKRTMLDLAIKTADLLVKDLGPGKLEIAPGHQVVEMGLVRMYEATGKKEYRDLAKFFLDIRGPGGEEYSQAHEKVVDQREPVGHAVRATYMYSGMADIAKLYADTSYLHALTAIWEDLVTKKMYVTGGIGSGGGNEGFDPPYILPNMRAYCETCASVGNIMWNYRMFLSTGDAKYYNVLERTLYNAFLSGVSLSGDRFFYPNVLESIGQHQRFGWDNTACCPPNLARTLPSVPGYIYATSDDAVYVNLYLSNTANFEFDGNPVEIRQKTGYPWKGNVEIGVNPEKKSVFTLKLRIPGWAEEEVLPGDLYHFKNKLEKNVRLYVNDVEREIVTEKGYAVIARKWKKGDVVRIEFPIEPREIIANEKVKDDLNKMALQRGPLVYTMEWPEAKDGYALCLIVDENQDFTPEFKPDFLNGVVVLNGKAKAAQSTEEGGVKYGEEQNISLIPYYSWNNRGPGEMMVWMPINEKNIRPLPLPTIASTSTVSAGHPSRMLASINDQLMPSESGDHTWPFLHWWPEKDTTEWIQYDFAEKATVSSCEVYWYDDAPFGGCRIPASWEVQYKSGDKWIPVKATAAYPVSKDKWDSIEFEPVETTALRLLVTMPKEFASGIHEWVVK